MAQALQNPPGLADADAKKNDTDESKDIVMENNNNKKKKKKKNKDKDSKSDTNDNKTENENENESKMKNESSNNNNNNNNKGDEDEDIILYDPKSVDPGGRGINEIYIVPRSFKLLEELEFSEKGLINESDLCKKFPNDINWINYGLDGFDESLTCWNASIIPIQDTAIGDRIYQLKMITGNTYPNDPPFLTFVQKVNLPCVDEDGTVLISKINKFEWDHEKTMLELLVAIRHMMNTGDAADKCAQIAAGTTYYDHFNNQFSDNPSQDDNDDNEDDHDEDEDEDEDED